MELLALLRLCIVFLPNWIPRWKDFSQLATNRWIKGQAELWLSLKFAKKMVGGGGWVGYSLYTNHSELKTIQA